MDKKYLEEYINFLIEYKRLDKKTIKAYKIDITQFGEFSNEMDILEKLKEYIIYLHNNYKPKTTKRKIASLKAYFKYLKKKQYFFEDVSEVFEVKFREPTTLPKIISTYNLQKLYKTVYNIKENSKDMFIVRDIAILELLLATGMRISEVCNLKTFEIDLNSGKILIFGKGSKERSLSIGGVDLKNALYEYERIWHKSENEYYFLNNRKDRISEQSVRFMIKKYYKMAGICQHITPHMFRHSFATMLLDQDVDIRHIQKMLGHSSINITEIYTHVSNQKQKEILTHKNPRNLIDL